MSAKQSVATYCKAQAEINKINKEHEEQKKILNERIKTCRSLLCDELSNKNISCIEVYDGDNAEPFYFRMKPVLPNINITMDHIVSIFQNVSREHLSQIAEKYQHDLPKMVISLVQNSMKEEREKNAGDKQSLCISTNRERGYQRDLKQDISDDTMQLAKDMLQAKKELTNLRQKQSSQKKESIDAQKSVENTVKEALKATDPSNMTTRVHMMHGENEWVYYLRCKEKEKTVSVGIRKVVPMIENAVVHVLDQHGLSREYNGTYNLGPDFWTALCKKIEIDFQSTTEETKIISKLSLDRGGPRQRRKD